ncbi:ABC-type proline/glycine betaine transport system ATPase subunit [Mesorhizobium soli]|nr:ABC-type proline/glycine betaine transport system ATPase subunit [Mesorhizobium soli]
MELVPPCLFEIETEPSTGCTIGVDDAGFDITAGETFVIMGLSGFGKST